VIPVLDARRMRAADAAAIRSGVPSGALMENAGAALADVVRRRFPEWRRVVVACGPGNNGGDGLVAARVLALLGIGTSVFTLGDPNAYRADPAENLARARAVGLAPISLARAGNWRQLSRALADCDGILDALFGTGLTRPLSGNARRAVSAVNASGRPVAAADLPSGLSADGGAILGPAVRAALTVAFGAPKPCHLLPPASGLCGRLAVADIGIPPRALAARAGRFWLAEPADVASRLPARPLEAHKADFGRLAVIAGSRGKAGAAILAARGALRAGAGLVTIFCPESLAPLFVPALPEAMAETLPESHGALAARGARDAIRALAAFDAAVVGPGLGTSAETVAFLEAVVAGTRLPLVMDADALNAFAGRPGAIAKRRAPVILTPHPGEAGRLLGRPARRIQADRLGAARSLARSSRGVAVLKGAHTLVAEARGDVVANPTGTPLLATAGAGDVLAGVVGALLCGGLSPRDAALAGVWLHGAAAEALEPRLSDAGLLAHEIADALPGVRRALRAGAAPDA
jgi:ADP-dependent NAD(P)H-hydrate dehydratase / NAD(P)H-hydrate epimerase